MPRDCVGGGGSKSQSERRGASAGGRSCGVNVPNETKTDRGLGHPGVVYDDSRRVTRDVSMLNGFQR
jgi:hypothetical protein